MVALAQLPPGALVLEPMCGCGTVAVLAARHAGAHVLAVDISSTERAAAEGNVRAFGAGLVHVLAADATALPLRDEAVDAVLVDLPWGMRHGSFRANQRLYPRVRLQTGPQHPSDAGHPRDGACAAARRPAAGADHMHVHHDQRAACGADCVC